MEPDLDILIWDKNRQNIQTFYKKCPARSIRVCIDRADFINSLTRKPKVIILNEIKEYSLDSLAETLRNQLTEDTKVITCMAGVENRRHLKSVLARNGVESISFDIESQWLWVSIYNIVEPRGYKQWNEFDFNEL